MMNVLVMSWKLLMVLASVLVKFWLQAFCTSSTLTEWCNLEEMIPVGGDE